MVVAEMMLRCSGTTGYGQAVNREMMLRNREKIFFTKNSAAARWILLMTRRPSPTIPGIAAKSDSSSTSWATWLAAWAPEAMAMPQSASFRASTSLTPSPVIATVWPAFFISRISRRFCSGVTRPKTVHSRAARA